MRKIIAAAWAFALLSRLCAGALKLDFDAAKFLADSSRYRWELYYSLPENSLKYVAEGKDSVGELYIKVLIKTSVDIVAEKEWIVSRKKSSGEKPLDLVGQKNFLLEPGQYEADIFARDLKSGEVASVSFDLILPKYPKRGIALSDIEIASSVQKITDSRNFYKPFVKKKLAVTPNPSITRVAGRDKAIAYAEIYNLDDTVRTAYSKFVALDESKKVWFEAERRDEIAPRSFVQAVYEASVDSMPTGAYKAEVAARWGEGGDSLIIVSRKKIYVINPRLGYKRKENFISDVNFETSVFATLTPKQTELEIRKAKYFASAEEMDKFDELTDVNAKRKALYQFWKKRDPDPSTPYNETLEDLRKREKYANSYFSFGNRKGWDTDRGRILLVYGMPDERIQHPFNGDNRAYEEWFYGSIQGGVYFYFVDLTGYGNYVLVHSTAYNEIYDPDWFSKYVERGKNENDFFRRNEGER